MQRPSFFKLFRPRRTKSIFEWLTSALSLYVVPVAIAIVSVTALFFWADPYEAQPERTLELRALIQTGNELSPRQARDQLVLQPLTPLHDNKLSEAPVWFSFLSGQASGQGMQVAFPSRHTQDMSCWDATTQTLLGKVVDNQPQGQLSRVNAGYALMLNQAGPEVICRATFLGPARLTAELWTPRKLAISSHNFHRNSGLLDGGVLVLTAFVLVVALVNRQKLYLIFAAWLVLGLRVASTSGGWDTQWLSHTIPVQWLTPGRSVTLACYALMTLALYREMFQDELIKTPYAQAIKFFHWLCIPLIFLALLLPRSLFIPTVWVLAGPGLVVMIISLGRIVIKTRSRVALWYGGSLAVTFLSSFSEILSAAYGIQGFIEAFNSVTAALTSGLLASLAIAEQMRQEHNQRLDAQAELQHTYNAMPIGLFTLDLQGRFISANPALLRKLGEISLMEGEQSWAQHFGSDAWLQLHRMVHDHRVNEMEISGAHLSGDHAFKRFLVRATLSRSKIEGSLQDVTDKSRAMEKLNFLANHDSLTEVLNRRGIGRQLAQAIDKVQDGKLLSLGYLDLDRFKLINDLYGHAAGDEVLRQVCQRVSSMISGDVQFGRVGGDEFVLVYGDLPIELATLLCRGIIDGISTLPYRVGDKAFYLRGSIGLVEVSPGMNVNDAMSYADRACRQAKSATPTGLVVYERDAPAFEQHEAELKLIALLASPAATDGLYLEMQPIMSLTAPHDSLNFEVLLRMRDAQGTVVRTDYLIAAGEASGQMGMIDRWVLATTLAWLKQNEKQLQNTRFVCMNLSGASLNDEQFLQDVYATLEQNLPLVSKLSLEITESVALHDVGNTRRFVDKVRGYGAKVALDDFGAGYTSFSYLKEFTADLLKIDGNFIVNMNQHPANVAIVEAIVNLAKNLGMKVIAEWAEDQATVQTLVEIGVDYVQGFVVARPQHPDHMLTAPSSASFIKGETLAEFVYQIGLPDVLGRTMMDFSLAPKLNLH